MLLLRHTRTFRALAAALTIVATAACQADEPTGSSPVSAAGAYNLRLITQGSTDCSPVGRTCEIQNTGGDEIAVTSGLLTLSNNGTFLLTVSGFENGTSGTLGTIAGTWAQTSTGVSFTVPGVPIAIPANWSTNVGQQLLFAAPGGVFGSSSSAVAVVFER